jgi:Mrp family chromosome partitioning ATPase
MLQLLDSLRSAYDIIIIDGPGVLEDEYTNNVAVLADISIFIIGALVTNKNAIDQSFQELDKFRVKPSGIVLNRVLPLYIEDEKIKAEMKRTNTLWKRILFWR